MLFSGSKELETAIVLHIANAEKEATPLDAVAAAFEAAGAKLQNLREFGYVRARHGLVVLHADLRERELTKLATLSAAATKALCARGVPEPSASLAAEAGIAVFKVGFERWVSEKEPRDLAAHIRAAMDGLKAVLAEAKAPTARRKKRQVRRA